MSAPAPPPPPEVPPARAGAAEELETAAEVEAMEAKASGAPAAEEASPDAAVFSGEPSPAVLSPLWEQLARRFPDLSWALSRRMQPYDPDHLTRVRREVMASPRIREALQRYVDENAVSMADAEKLLRRWMKRMFADVRPNYVRTLGYAARKIWKRMYEAIHCNEDGIAMLRELGKAGICPVLCPTHASYNDFLVVTYEAFAHELALPTVVAGANLNMAGVGTVLQRGGAMFIRRSFSDDDLYKALFHEYLAAIMRRGQPVECFIEGGRRRSGKVLAPKTGFLEVVCQLVAEGRVKDAALVPISITYDKVIEGSSYVSEMLGAAKEKESLRGFIDGFNRVVRLNFGSIEVNIMKPIRVRELVTGGAPPLAGLPAYGGAGDRRFLRALAYRVLYECNVGQTATATMLVAAVLMTTVNRGVHMKELVSRVEWLRAEVELRGGRVARLFRTESTAAVVDRALAVLGRLVQRQNNVLFGFKHKESLEIGMYRNQITHYFVSEALVAVAMAAEAPDAHSMLSLSVEKDRLLQSVRFVSRLLKLEFVYKPGPDLADNFERTLEDMKRRGIIVPSANGRRLTVDRQGVDMFNFLCRLLWPVVDTYFVTVSSLVLLQPDRIVEESRLCRLASRRAEALYYAGHTDFFEVINVQAIKLAVSWCISSRLLTSRRVEGVWAHRLLQLAPDYQQKPERLTELVTRISHFRMASTSRRDPGAVLKYYNDDFASSEGGNFFARLGGGSKL